MLQTASAGFFAVREFEQRKAHRKGCVKSPNVYLLDTRVLGLCKIIAIR